MKPSNVRRGLVAIATVMVCALGASGARAQSEADKKQQAKVLFEKATRLYDVGKYGEAIDSYEQAYLLIGDAALLFNIGQAYRLWDRPDDAIRAYKNYLRQRPDAVNRADVEKKISDLEQLAEDRRRGEKLPPTGPVPAGVPPGVPAAPSGAAAAVPPAEAPPPPEPIPAAEPGPPPAGVVVDGSFPAAPASPPPRNWLAYSLLGVGGACLLTATVAGAVGASKAKKLQDASQNKEPFDPAVEANGKTANVVAVVFGVAGLATGGVGGYLLWRGRKAESASVAIVPAVAPSYAGGSALLTF